MTRIILVLCTIVFACCVLRTGDAQSFKPECRKWEEVSTALESNQLVNLSCTVKPTCTGLDCNGFIAERGTRSVIPLGIEFKPCQRPLEMDIYGGDPPTSETFIASSSKEPYVRKMSLNAIILRNLTLQITMFVAFNTFVLPVNEYATIKINATIDVVLKSGVSFSFDVDLVPLTTILVPMCFDMQTVPATTGRPTEPMPVIDCVPYEMGSCKMYQVCSYKTRVCTCIVGYYWDHVSGLCNTDKYPEFPLTSTTAKTSIDTIVMIAAPVTFAFLILFTILAIVFTKYFQRRRQTEQRTPLLLNGEATNDDDETLQDAPMIQA